MKFVDQNRQVTVQATVIGAEVDPANNHLSAVGQGTSNSQRIGAKVTMQSIHINGYVKFGNGAILGQSRPMDFVRIVVYLDKQTNNGQAQAEDVLEDTPAVGDMKTLMFPRVDEKARFRILRDFKVRQGPTGVYSNGSIATQFESDTPKIPFSCRINLKGIVQRWVGDSTSAAIGSVNDNSVHIIAISSDQLADGQITYVSRYNYFDA